MLQLSGALLANMDVRKLLEAISASLREVVPHDAATLGLYESATGTLIVQFLGADEGNARRGDVRLPVEGSPSGSAFRTGEPVVVDRMQDSKFAQESMRHLTSLGMQSGCWVPLVHRGEAIGVLAVASRLEGAFGQREAEMLAEIGGHGCNGGEQCGGVSADC